MFYCQLWTVDNPNNLAISSKVPSSQFQKPFSTTAGDRPEMGDWVGKPLWDEQLQCENDWNTVAETSKPSTCSKKMGLPRHVYFNDLTMCEGCKSSSGLEWLEHKAPAWAWPQHWLDHALVVRVRLYVSVTWLPVLYLVQICLPQQPRNLV
jgi:hypothetical protein